MASLSEQAAAVEAVRRTLAGATKMPRPNTSQAHLLAAQLEAAARTLRQMEARHGER